MRAFCKILLTVLCLTFATPALAAFKTDNPQAVHDTLRKAEDAMRAKEFSKAKTIISDLVKQEEPISMYIMGFLAASGSGQKQDFKEAEKWWIKASGAGLPNAQFNLGMLYYSGAMGSTDMKKARDQWVKAAGVGHPDAQFGLGLLQMTGQGGAKETANAIKNFQAAAERGHPQALMAMGKAYATGEGVKKDTKKAKEWFEKAKKAGVPVPDDIMKDLGK